MIFYNQGIISDLQQKLVEFDKNAAEWTEGHAKGGLPSPTGLHGGLP